MCVPPGSVLWSVNRFLRQSQFALLTARSSLNAFGGPRCGSVIQGPTWPVACTYPEVKLGSRGFGHQWVA